MHWRLSCWVLALFGWEGAGSAGTGGQTPGWTAVSDAQMKPSVVAEGGGGDTGVATSLQRPSFGGRRK